MSKLGPMAPSATTVFHKSLFDESKGFDESLYWAMDYDLWIQFFKLGDKYYNLHEYIYAFRINEKSKTLSDGINTKRSEERIRQTAYLLKKNRMVVKMGYLPLWRLLKCFLVGFQRLWDNYKWRGRDLRWWKR